MVIDDIRKTFEAVFGQLTPTKAQQVAKRFQPNAAREQVTKTASELILISQRMREAVRKEVASQVKSMGVATQDDLDALRKRVRDLERAVGKGSSRRAASRKTTTRKSSARAASSTPARSEPGATSTAPKPSAAS